MDKNLQASLKNAIVSIATTNGINSANNRACRWGGDMWFPMLVGQATTPAALEPMIAALLTGDKKYADVVHTTADYFLGSNPLHTTWITQVGPRPAECGFHLDTRYNNKWKTYPGFIPYGPWSMAFGFTPYTWVIDGVSIQGGHGTWNKDWANFTVSPLMNEWPGHERWSSNIHAPLATENTIHQNSVYGAITYGFVNNRRYENGTSPVKFGAINLNKTEIKLTSAGAEHELIASPDVSNAISSALKWSSSDPNVATVDEIGRITAVAEGVCVITCSALDDSVSAICNVFVEWPTNSDFLPNPAKNQITVSCPTGIKQMEVFNLSGQKISDLQLDGDLTNVYLKEFSGTGLFFVRITDAQDYTHLRKVIFE